MKHIEAGGERQELTGVDKVFARQLYANGHFPRTGFAITAYTFETLFSDTEPEKLIKEFLKTPLTKEWFSAMKKRADDLHRVFLPQGEIPTLDFERLSEFWETDQMVLLEFLRLLMGVPRPRVAGQPYELSREVEAVTELMENHALPVEEVRASLTVIVATLKESDIKKKLSDYRTFFKEEYWNSSDSTKNEEVKKRQKEIQSLVFSRAREAITLPTETTRKVFEFLNSIT